MKKRRKYTSEFKSKVALEVYAYVKVAGTGAGLDELKAMMGKRFAQKRKIEVDPAKTAA